MNAEDLLLPPSPLYPAAGALVGYLLPSSEKKMLGLIAGGLVGMIVNVATRSIQLQSDNTKLSGGTEFHSSLGKELLNAALGKKAEPVTTVAVTSGPFTYRLRGVG